MPSSPRWAACILPSVKHIASLALGPVCQLNLSSGYSLVIHKYLVNGSHNKALAFNWLVHNLHQQFTLPNTHLKRAGCLCSVIIWLPIFKDMEHSHRVIQHLTKESLAQEEHCKKFLHLADIWELQTFFWTMSKYWVCEFIHKKKPHTNHFLWFVSGMLCCWKSQQPELICYL